MKNWATEVRKEYRSLLNEFKNPKTEELLWIKQAA
jgi:hypothetical protein